MKVTLREAHEVKAGDRSELIPTAANWRFQGNTIADCRRPIVLDSYGGRRDRDNAWQRDAR